MRLVAPILLWLLLAGFCPVLIGVTASNGAEQPEIPAKHHPWGRFGAGSWKQVRITTETLDEQGAVSNRSYTDTKTILLEVEKDGVRLKVETMVEVSGKRFRKETEEHKQGFHGELAGRDLKINEPKTGEIVIQGRKVPCKILQLESAGAASKTATSIYYSGEVAPYVLKRRSVTTDLSGENSLSETSVDVMALNMPFEVMEQIVNSHLVRTVHEYPHGTVTTWSSISREVPGGVVWQSSRETDVERRLVSRSTLKVTGYGRDADSQRSGVLSRIWTGRTRKPKTDPRKIP
ncbi:MAG: hypothetical protein HQ567_08395 [Candidatus Nealsonbacteria bacterium]|nr:hypothetical protein [Candidatus Nealsonbacteria bacterium]